MNLSENLKKIRKENNLSQEQLAEKLGVSRQAVSKWESNQAYPEMDKVVQLAQMFHLNIDDLLNQDIGEVNSEKQAKTAINKYVDDFLAFLTKTVDMFSSMKWRDRIKCIFEQILIVCFFIIVLSIIAMVGDSILIGLLSMLPNHIEYIIHSIFESIYLIISFILITILLAHIFKTRYLDYYVIVKGNKKEETINEEENNQEEKIVEEHEKTTYLKKKQEKVVIRDPKHSDYKFISGMLKGLLWMLKGFVLIFVFFLCFMLIGLVIALMSSFLIIKTGIFFIGILLAVLSTIVMTILFLTILLNFIMNRKNKKKMILITFIVSVVLMGIGFGTTIIGFTQFDYIDEINNSIYQEDELVIPMEDNLIISNLHYYQGNYITYIEEEREDIKIVYKHTKYYRLSYKKYDSNMDFYLTVENPNVLKTARDWLKDINDKKIINYGKARFYVYISKENMERIKENNKKYYEEEKVIEENIEGYVSIDKLPKEYSIHQMIEDNVIVITHDKNYNTNIYDEFIEKLKKKQDAFLRIGSFTIEGDIIITDIKYDSKTEKAIITTDNTRDKFSNDKDRKIKSEVYEHLEEHDEVTERGGVRELITYNGILENDYRVLLSFQAFID